MIVHGDEAVRLVLTLALAEDGYRTEAHGHRHALAALEASAERPRAVLLDLHGPIAAFLEALERRHGVGVPIIALTTRPENCEGESVGAAAVLPQPFEVDDLLALVARYCGAN